MVFVSSILFAVVCSSYEKRGKQSPKSSQHQQKLGKGKKGKFEGLKVDAMRDGEKTPSQIFIRESS